MFNARFRAKCLFLIVQSPKTLQEEVTVIHLTLSRDRGVEWNRV